MAIGGAWGVTGVTALPTGTVGYGNRDGIARLLRFTSTASAGEEQGVSGHGGRIEADGELAVRGCPPAN